MFHSHFFSVPFHGENLKQNARLASFFIFNPIRTSAKVSRNTSNLIIQTAFTFDLKEIFQFCFDILKDKKIIFNINSGFYIGINI